ncbi:syntaxin-7-like [Culicoides brevitarsis]|uniref:syntaxin-7-like n=1 Tax=Culicoides brevitarsis TaxID=469753 RepID=UPI00307C2235
MIDEEGFQQQATQIGARIRKVQQNVATMQRHINQLAQTHGEDQSVKQQFHRMRLDTQQLIQDADSSLNNLNFGSARHLKLQRERLLDEFGSAINVFQEVQRKYVEQEKKFVREVKEHRHEMMSKHPTEDPLEADLGFPSTHPASQIQQQEEIDLRALEEQERAIQELEENIANVNEIYKKLGALVYEQGTVIDSIEASVENTAAFVEEGAQQLQQASRYRNKVRRRKVFLILLGIAILSTIFLVFYFGSN